MAIIQLDDDAPQLAPGAWVADSATVIGRVCLAEDASVWYGAVLRGDDDWIRVGRSSNVQDGSVLHADPGCELVIGDDVTVGHQAMLHGCTIGDGTLVGIQAVVLNGARIGRRCVIGAGALVTENKVFGDGALIVGAPARLVGEVSAEQFERLAQASRHYVQLMRRHRDRSRRCG